MKKELLIALSISNLCFIGPWVELLQTNGGYYFSAKSAPTPVQFLALALDILLLGLAVLAVAFLVKRTKSPLVTAVAAAFFFGLALIFGFGALQPLPFFSGVNFHKLMNLFGRTGLIGISLLLLLPTGWAVVKWRGKLIRPGATIALLASPFLLFTIVQGMWFASGKAAIYRYNFEDKEALSLLPRNNAATPRVLWLIFDEMDYRLSMQERPASLKLLELDRLCKESLCATNAHAPASKTDRSIPSLISGRIVLSSTPIRPDELMVTFGDETGPAAWSAQPNVFQKARELGVNTALIGWYLPYCRILGNSLTMCRWYEYEWPQRSTGSGLAEIMTNQFRSLVETKKLSLLGQSLSVRKRVANYEAVLADAMSVSSNPTFGFVLVHWPIPHDPFIYDRDKRDLSLANNLLDGYFGNLALVDRTLGHLRAAMERAGTWEDTTVILSSDHHWRESSYFNGQTDFRVPFVIKIAHNGKGERYEGRVNTVLTKDLIIAFLKRDLQTLRDLVGWLDENRGRYGP